MRAEIYINKMIDWLYLNHINIFLSMSYSPSQFICYFYKILTKLLSLEIY